MKVFCGNDSNGRVVYYHRVYHWNCRKFFMNIFILLLAVGILLICYTTRTQADQTPRSVIVKSGDTLWTIAQTTRPHQDPRITIENIREINQLNTVNIQPGQKILVP
jgi:hypothetical protein